jgi:autotransporter-associated beta strand protein
MSYDCRFCRIICGFHSVLICHIHVSSIMKTSKTNIITKSKLCAIALCILTTQLCWLSAQTLYWHALPSGTWSDINTSNNWSTSPLPPGNTNWVTGSDAVIVASNPSITVGQASALTVNAASLDVQNGATFVGGATAARVLNVAGAISGNFTINITATGGGGISANGAANYNGTATIQSGYFALNNTAAGSTNSHFNLTGGTLALGTPIISSSVTIGSLSGTSGNVSPNFGGSPGVKTLLIDQSSNTTFSGAFAAGTGGRILAVAKTGTGTLTLNGTNTHQGPTAVGGGTLMLAATNTLQSATGDLIVNGSTAVLNTSVSNANIGGNVTLTSGTVRINDSGVGTLTLAATRDFTMNGGTLELGLGTAYDQILGGSSFNISGGTLSLDVTLPGFSYSNTYNIFSGFSSGSVSGLTITGYDTVNYIATLNNSGELSFTIIPEPSSVLLILAAVSGAALCRSRKK